MTASGSGSCRKRAHSEEDDCDGCLPIAKRITRLQICYEGRTSSDDYLDLLGTDNNNGPAVDSSHQPWGDHPPDHVRSVPGPPGSPQSPGPLSNIPGSPPWPPQVEFPANGVPGGSNIVSELSGFQPTMQNGPLVPTIAPCGMPIIDNMLNVPSGSHNPSEHQVEAEQAYEPELSEMENPHYYHSNQVLYYAHMSRLQRLSSLGLSHPTFHLPDA